MLWFWLFILLILLAVALLPAWPYARARNWGYAPTGCALGLVVLLLILFWLGVLTVAWPWYPAY